MSTTLIVLAHPDKRSFNGAWADATERAAIAQGDTVLWSDLYAMGFHPAEAAARYPDWEDATQFDPLKAQEDRAQSDRLPLDVAGEIAKIRQADRVVFHFPLWWFAPPAILKGWFDRAFAHGALHSVEQRFDTGLCRGKTALFCVTTGSRAEESAFNGKEGDVQMLLWPAAYTLRYLGFTVLVPRIVHGVHGFHKGARRQELETRLQDVLQGQADLLASCDTRACLPFNADDDFDAQGRLLPDRASHSPFIRQRE
ncbi:MAG: NAD(P)H-dependent oxidoreductase [Yoonia sp.]|uniref:NAD(P)H-dependent oxidoreductase n=1 Tax=Yoonia sp. TaxID=2212373 RepID=UPI00273D31D5|nr:NAD(P)H-dependent oxidoreductase [Yoonia sp.]MDP5085012.1 NAD(P)H-dependent oxidoreductase [Yoonia sp.]